MPAPTPRLSDPYDAMPEYATETYEARPDAPEPDAAGVQDALRTIQAHLGELHRAREGFAKRVRDLEAQLGHANTELATLRGERDHLARLKGLYERKFASIREITQQ